MHSKQYSSVFWLCLLQQVDSTLTDDPLHIVGLLLSTSRLANNMVKEARTAMFEGHLAALATMACI